MKPIEDIDFDKPLRFSDYYTDLVAKHDAETYRFMLINERTGKATAYVRRNGVTERVRWNIDVAYLKANGLDKYANFR